MEKEILKKRLKDFNEYVTSGKSKGEIFVAYEKFYKWLKNRIGEASTDEEIEVCLTVLCDLINSSIKWVQREGIIFKELASNWDWRTVKFVGQFVNDYKAVQKENGGNLPDTKLKSPMTIRKGVVLNRIFNEATDFATIGYCCQMLQTSGIINFYNVGHYSKETSKDEVFLEKKEDEMKYWSTEIKEMVTKQEAIDRGLKLYLLAYPDGHLMQGLFAFSCDGEERKTNSTEEIDESKLTDDERQVLRQLDKVIQETMTIPVTIVD